MTTAPTFVGAVGADGGATSGNTYTTTFTSIAPRDGDYLIWLVMVEVASASLTTPPTGWSLRYGPTTVGSRTVIVYDKVWHTGDPTTLSYVKSTANADGNAVAAYRGLDVAGVIRGLEKKRQDQSPTNSLTNTAPSVTTAAANTRAIVVSAEATSAAESGGFLTGPTIPSGWTQDFYKAQGTTIQTIAFAHKDLSTAGASGDAIITYQNTQGTNGWAVQLALPPALPSTATVKLKASDGNLHDSQIWLADGAGGLRSVTAVHAVGRGAGTPSALVAKPGFVVGHMGARYDEVEGSMEGITRALHWGADALMLSLQRTSDGKYFILNDAATDGVAYLDRMSLGVADGKTLDPRTMTWATLSSSYDQGSYWTQRATSSPRRPYLLLSDFLTTYPTVGPILLDPKTIPAAYYSGILDVMDANGGPSRFVAKYYCTGTAWAAAAHARGYLTWGFFYAAEIAAGTTNLDTLAPSWDWLGLDIGGATAQWTQMLAKGKPVIGHIANTRADYNTGIGKGAAGIMAAGVAEAGGYA